MEEIVNYGVSHLTVLKTMKEIYNKAITKIKKLEGYIDKNFLVTEDRTANQYVLKIKFRDYPHKQANRCHEAMFTLKKQGINCSYPIQSTDGQRVPEINITVDSGDEIRCRTELLAFVPGCSITESKLQADELLQVCYGVGSFCGLICKHLMGTEEMEVVREDYIWFSQNFCKLTDQYLQYVKDIHLYKTIQEISYKFKNVLPSFTSLRKGYVHNDMSNTNVILADSNTISPRNQYKDVISRFGIIDFEHLHEGYIIFELAICVAYMMTEGVSRGVDNVLDIGANIVTGFKRCTPLTEAEKDILYLGVLVRFCSSYVMSQYSLAQDPMNEKYIMRQAAKCPDLIYLFCTLGKKGVMEHWEI